MGAIRGVLDGTGKASDATAVSVYLENYPVTASLAIAAEGPWSEAATAAVRQAIAAQEVGGRVSVTVEAVGRRRRRGLLQTSVALAVTVRRDPLA